MIKPGVADELLAAEVEHHVLRLRELLVRWDENMKAWQLLSSVPYWAIDRPMIRQARADQFEMVKHALDEHAYEAYYGENPHERPFEEQTGLSVEQACMVPRVDWLLGHLKEVEYVIDLSANDGWMLAYLEMIGVGGHGFDLNAGAAQRARDERGVTVYNEDFRTPKTGPLSKRAAAVVLFETLEHLPDPIEGLRAAAKYVEPGGHLFVSTPIGATEGGDLPTWAHVERKGHLWSFRPEDFQAMLESVGEVQGIWSLPDRTMAAEVLVAR